MMEQIITGVFLLILSIWDIRKKAVPMRLLIIGAMLSLGGSVVKCFLGNESWGSMVIGTLPGMGMLLIAWTTGKVGCADGIVLAGMGMLMGCGRVVFCLCVSLLILSLFSISLLILKKVSRDSKMPYIPFLTIAFLLQRGSELLKI